MKLFLDTANLEEIREATLCGFLDGITTNPSLLANEKILSLESHIKKICEMVDGPVSVEVLSNDRKSMLEEGLLYSTWAQNIVVKIPMTRDGLIVVNELRKNGVSCNVTLIFSANQALLAAKAGARFVSPFIGRLDDNGEDGLRAASEMRAIFDNYDFETEILAASVRHPRHVSELALIGADIATLPKSIFDKLFKHPMTDLGLEQFIKDWQKTL